MITDHPNDPLHGKTLKAILEFLLEKHGWSGLARRIDINCFKKDPSISSSLTFLRKTPWAREKVEILYLKTIGYKGPDRNTFKPLSLE